MTEPEPAAGKSADAEPPKPPRRRRALRARPSAPPVTWRAGVHITGTRLWCDAQRAHDLCFLSSVQAVGRRGQRAAGTLLCTEQTLLLQKALGGPVPAPGSVLLSPFGRPFHLGALRLELFPSGYGPGAASLWIKLPSGSCITYAGTPCAEPEPHVESMQVRAAETLICAAPLAAHGAALPDRDAALASLDTLVAEARAADAVAVILCSTVPGAPTIWRRLSSQGITVVAHPEIERTLRAYGELGFLPPHADGGSRRLGRAVGPGTVILWPAATPLVPVARLRGSAAGLRVILCTGAAQAAALVTQVRAALPSDAGFAGAVALADSLDQPALLRYIADSEARHVYLTAGYSDSLAAAAQRLGVRLEPLGPPHQLQLFRAG